jgi:hypothetical protein
LPFHVLHYSPCFILLSSDNILLNSASTRGQAEKEFKVEVEAIGRVRHKNLVRLLGYCVEGAYRYVCWWHIAISSSFGGSSLNLGSQ